jgi:hypothetical protein
MQEAESPTRIKFRRNSSHSILVNQDFHQEFKHRLSNAQAKEEGEFKENRRMFKRLPTLDTKNYDLQDSDDEDSLVSPTISPRARLFS